jgi:hypothetical protein
MLSFRFIEYASIYIRNSTYRWIRENCAVKIPMKLNDNIGWYLFRYVYKITNYLTSQNIAHNMSIVKGDSFSSSSAALRILSSFVNRLSVSILNKLTRVSSNVSV